MKIKKFNENIASSFDDYNKRRDDLIKTLGDRMLGKLFRIHPTRDPNKEIVIAKMIEVIGLNSTWGNFNGYIIYPDSEKGKNVKFSEFLSDWFDSIPTEKEVELYKYYDEIHKYNL